MNRGRVSTLVTAALRAGRLGSDHPMVMLTDLDQLDDNVQALRTAFPPDALHAVAVKANPLRRVLERVVQAGLGLEAASPGELAHALSIVGPDRVVFDSPVKTVEDLTQAVRGGIRINVDSLQELFRVAALSPVGGIGLRVNPGLRAGSIEATSTGMQGSKFGIDLDAHREEVLAAASKWSWIDGLHVHVGSQGCSIDLLVEGVRVAVDLAGEIAQRGGRVRVVDVGGGLPVNYMDDSGPDFAVYAERLRARLPELFDGRWRLVTEFGRHLHARHTIVVSRVEYTKQSGGRQIAVVHVGADLFARTAYQPTFWPHRVDVFTADGVLKTGAVSRWDVAGPLCFSGDLLATDRLLSPVNPGDLIVVHDAGAYTLSMWNFYNSRVPPEVLGWTDLGGLEVLKQRTSPEELLRFWE